MTYQWRLLILLLTISLVPIMVLRSMGKRALSKFGDVMIERFEKQKIQEIQEKLQIIAESYSSTIWHGRKSIEIALDHIASQTGSALASPYIQSPAPIYIEDSLRHKDKLPKEFKESSRHFRMGRDKRIQFVKVSYENQVFQFKKEKIERKDLEKISRLTLLTPAFQRIERHLGNSVLWFHTGLNEGLYGGFPGHTRMPSDMDFRKQLWFNTEETKTITWTSPYVDPVTGQAVIAATLPIYNSEGKSIGKSALVISISHLLDKMLFARKIPASTEFYIVYFESSSAKTDTIARIYIKDEHTELTHRTWDYVFKPEWLTSENKDEFDAMIRDIRMGKSGNRKMPYQKEESIWSYGPSHPDAFICMITPYKYFMEETSYSRKQFENEVSDLIQITHYGMTITLSVVCLLSFLFSRTVTKPIKALVDGAKELASGNFDVRVHIKSKDEFGKMGEVFNMVGPQLMERYKMRQLLDIAMEVQQNLLPKNTPVIKGIDIAGKSVYCDETGGDYYDFIDKKGRGVDIVVGDVSGHGIPSALLMTTARAFIRQRAYYAGPPSDIVTDVNRLLAKDTEDSGQFMTLFYANVCMKDHTIRWVLAGHDPVIIYNSDTGVFEKLYGKGIPIGIFDDYIYIEKERKLKKGQIIIAGTDGIREAFNPKGEMFGSDRLYHIIRKNAHKNAEGMIEIIFQRLREFQENRISEDDLTLVIVKVNE